MKLLLALILLVGCRSTDLSPDSFSLIYGETDADIDGSLSRGHRTVDMAGDSSGTFLGFELGWKIGDVADRDLEATRHAELMRGLYWTFDQPAAPAAVPEPAPAPVPVQAQPAPVALQEPAGTHQPEKAPESEKGQPQATAPKPGGLKPGDWLPYLPAIVLGVLTALNKMGKTSVLNHKGHE